MQTTILSFANLHEHGALFANFLRARHRTFIEANGWPLPSTDGMEFDQYDTPQSRWVVFHQPGSDEVLGGFRMTHSRAECGIYSYMLRDAANGLLATIPASILAEDAPQADDLWECSRAFITDAVPPEERAAARRALIKAFMPSVEAVGGTRMITLTNTAWPRWMPMHGVKGEAMGPKTRIDDAPFQAVMMTRLAA